MIEELPDELEQDELDDIEPVGDENQLYEHFRVVVDKGQAMVRVDKYLFERIVNASRNRIQKAAEDGFVMANGKPVKSSYKVKPLDVITVMMDRPRYDNEIIPEDIPLNIVYEDKYLMVVNKPAGLVVHPGHGNYHGTLVNAIAWHLKDNPDYGQICMVTPITSYPCSFKRYAATEESTPPDIPTTTFFAAILFSISSISNIFYSARCQHPFLHYLLFDHTSPHCAIFFSGALIIFLQNL